MRLDPIRILRAAARRGAGTLGLDVVPRHEPLLARAHRLGLRPATVLDVGAAWGRWSEDCHAVFPDARFVLVEPLEELAPALDLVAARLGRAERVTAAATSTRGERTLHVHRDLVGTSLFHEAEGPAVDGKPRVVPTVTLDGLVEERGASGPYLVKLDVQGGELDVLAGAANVLAASELLVLEASFFEFFEGGPLAHDLIAWLRERGLVLYDVSEPTYRPLDGALAQANLAFAPERGPLRRDHRFATREQRAEQDAAFERAHRRRR